MTVTFGLLGFDRKAELDGKQRRCGHLSLTPGIVVDTGRRPDIPADPGFPMADPGGRGDEVDIPGRPKIGVPRIPPILSSHVGNEGGKDEPKGLGTLFSRII